ncbi:MAG: ATP-binding protein [Deltaproteobacteria bacterium]|nr:ATP-binding protein [Deltaproteobacteria bacterium]
MIRQFGIAVGIQSSTRYLPWLRRLVGAIGRANGRALSPAVQWRCTVALIEAVDNAIVHAHHRAVGRRIWVHCRIADRRITIAVQDNGAPFRPPGCAVPKPLLTRGRGIYLMRELMHRARFRRFANGNVVTLTYEF